MNLLYLHSWYLQEESVGEQNAQTAAQLIISNADRFPVVPDLAEVTTVKKQSAWMLAVLLHGGSLQENTDMLAAMQSFFTELNIPAADNKSFLPARGNTIREELQHEYTVFPSLSLQQSAAVEEEPSTQEQPVPADEAEEESPAALEEDVQESVAVPDMSTEEQMPLAAPEEPSVVVEETIEETVESEVAPSLDAAEAEKLAEESQTIKNERSALRKQKRKKRLLKAILSVVGIAAVVVLAFFFIQSRRNAAVVTYTNETFAELAGELQKDESDQWINQIYSALHLDSVSVEDGEDGYKLVTMHVSMPLIEEGKIPFSAYDYADPHAYLSAVFTTCADYIAGAATQQIDIMLDVLPADSGYEHTYHITSLSSLKADAKKASNAIWRSIAASGSVLDATTDILFPDPVLIDYDVEPPADIDPAGYTNLYKAYMHELSEVLSNADLEIKGLDSGDAEAIYQVLYQKLAAKLYAPYEPVLSWSASLETLMYQITIPSFDDAWQEIVDSVFEEIRLHVADGLPTAEELEQKLLAAINQEAISLRYYSTGQPSTTFAVDLQELATYGVTVCSDAVAFAYQHIDLFNQAYDQLTEAVATIPPYEKQERPETAVIVGNSGDSYMKVTLNTTAGDGDHFVKFVLNDAEATESSLSVYIRDGESVTAYLPQGEYKILHAMGTDWYGDTYFFGVDGDYFLNNKTLTVYTGYVYTTTLPGAAASETGSAVLDMFTF